MPLQQEDIDYYRYHPLQLNASFLGHLSEEDQRVLGFGNSSNFQRGYRCSAARASFQTLMERSHDAQVLLAEFYERVKGKLRRLGFCTDPSDAG